MTNNGYNDLVLPFDYARSAASWDVIADRFAAFQRFLRENDLTVTSTKGSLPADLAYRLKSFSAELE